MSRFMLGAIAATLVVGVVMAVAPGATPKTGKARMEFDNLDSALLEHMALLQAKCLTVAVSLRGELIYSRGFGWRDQGGRQPCQPDAMMRIASVSKPVTAAAVRELVVKGQLTLDTPAFKLLALKPPKGGKVDPEMSKITVGDLLDHKGGWDRAASFDPMFAVPRIKKELGLTRAPNPADVVRFMQTQPLDFEPGKKVAYSNFGYCVLGRVLEKAYGKPYFATVQELVLKPHGVADVRLGVDQASRRDPREVEYPAAEGLFSIDVMDAHGGLVASAPALCAFMSHYVLNGETRQPGGTIDSTFFGSMPGTTAMARQRKDGLNIAVLINNRRDAYFNEDLTTLDSVVDKALAKLPPGQ